MEKSLKSKLSEVINKCAADLLNGDSGITTPREISEHIQDVHPMLVSAAAKQLVSERLQDMAREALRRVAATVGGGSKQLDLPLGLIDLQLPGAISFREGAEDKWVSLKKAKLVHLRSHRDILRNQVAADTARMDAFVFFCESMADVMEASQDITVAEALTFLKSKEAA